MAPVSITSSMHFDTLVKGQTYTIVDFYADWCGPCKMIAPVFAQLAAAESKPGRMAFCKVDVDAHRDIAGRFGVSAMPTFLVLKGSSTVETIRGANASALKSAVQRAAGDAARGPAKSSAAFQGGAGRTLGSATANAASSAASTAAMSLPGTGILDTLIRFVALYLTTLFSLHAESAARGSQFALPGRR